MNMNILDTARALSDGDLLARLPAWPPTNARRQPSSWLTWPPSAPSFALRRAGVRIALRHCRHALRLSEDAASNRIHAARACLKFPVILELLGAGELSLSTVRMLSRHLTMENHERVLGRARNARRPDIERLVAELAPRPDVPPSVRRLALPRTSGLQPPVFAQPPPPELPAWVHGRSEDLITTQNMSGPVGIDLAPQMSQRSTRPTATPCVPRRSSSRCRPDISVAVTSAGRPTSATGTDLAAP